MTAKLLHYILPERGIHLQREQGEEGNLLSVK